MLDSGWRYETFDVEKSYRDRKKSIAIAFFIGNEFYI